MLFKKKPGTGICFAWLPKSVPEGVVWLEWVHYEEISHYGRRYARYIPNDRYDADERCSFPGACVIHETWEQEQARLFAGPPPKFYTTPPDISQCRNYQRREPNAAVACWHPHCTCMDVGGSTCPE